MTELERLLLMSIFAAWFQKRGRAANEDRPIIGQSDSCRR